MSRRFARAAALLAALSLSSLAGCHRDAPVREAERAKVVAAERQEIRAELAQHRAAQIARLEAYAQAGVFPKNYDSAAPVHKLRDEDGNLCAVADLLFMDGRRDVLESAIRNKNDLAIADVRDGDVMQWVLESGLTQEELVRVQLPLPPEYRGQAQKAGPQPVAYVPPPPSPWMLAEQAKSAIRAHLAQVDAELRANTDASLDVAVARLMAARASS